MSCEFKDYRLIFYPGFSDVADLAVIAEIALKYEGASQTGLMASLGESHLLSWEQDTRYSSAAWAVDGDATTAWVSMSASPLILSLNSASRIDTICITPAILPVDGLLSFQVEGRTESNTAWMIRSSTTNQRFTTAGQENCTVLTSPADWAASCSTNGTANGTAPAQLPTGWRFIGGEPMPCASKAICLDENTCAEYNAGSLCEQCQFSLTQPSTRLLNAFACEKCAQYVHEGSFASAVVIFTLIAYVLIWWQWKAGVPRKVKPNDPAGSISDFSDGDNETTAMVELPEQNRSETGDPHYRKALVRGLLDHVSLCTFAWDYSSLSISLPDDYQKIGARLQPDLFSLRDLRCILYKVPGEAEQSLAIFLIMSMTVFPLLVDLLAWRAARRRLKTLTTDPHWLSHCDCGCPYDPDTESNFCAQCGRTKHVGVMSDGKWPSAMQHGLAASYLLIFLQLPLWLPYLVSLVDCNELPSEGNKLRHDSSKACQVNLALIYFGAYYVFLPCLLTFAMYYWTRSSIVNGTVPLKRWTFCFMGAGYSTNRLWYPAWKILLRAVPVFAYMLGQGNDVIGTGGLTTRSLGYLITVGIIGLLSLSSRPFHNYEHEIALMSIEGLTWCAFISAPWAKLCLGEERESIIYQGLPYTTFRVRKVSSAFEWSMVFIVFVLYLAGFLLIFYHLLRRQKRKLKLPEAAEATEATTQKPKAVVKKLDHLTAVISERVNLVMPREDGQVECLAKVLADLITYSFMAASDKAGDDPHQRANSPPFVPGAALEAILLHAIAEPRLDLVPRAGTLVGSKKEGKNRTVDVSFEVLLDVAENLRKFKDDAYDQPTLRNRRGPLRAGAFAENCVGRVDVEVKKVKGNLENYRAVCQFPRRGEDELQPLMNPHVKSEALNSFIGPWRPDRKEASFDGEDFVRNVQWNIEKGYTAGEGTQFRAMCFFSHEGDAEAIIQPPLQRFLFIKASVGPWREATNEAELDGNALWETFFNDELEVHSRSLKNAGEEPLVPEGRPAAKEAQDTPPSKAILFAFKLDSVDHRSLGFQSVPGENGKLRLAVQKSLEQACAAVAELKQATVSVKPTGKSQMVGCAVLAVGEAPGEQPTEIFATLRKKLGPQSTRRAWITSLHTDLVRVGVLPAQTGDDFTVKIPSGMRPREVDHDQIGAAVESLLEQASKAPAERSNETDNQPEELPTNVAPTDVATAEASPTKLGKPLQTNLIDLIPPRTSPRESSEIGLPGASDDEDAEAIPLPLAQSWPQENIFKDGSDAGSRHGSVVSSEIGGGQAGLSTPPIASSANVPARNPGNDLRAIKLGVADRTAPTPKGSSRPRPPRKVSGTRPRSPSPAQKKNPSAGLSRTSNEFTAV